MSRDELVPLAPEEGVERFLDYREPSVRKNTLQNARTRLKHFLEWCEEYDVENLNDLSGRDLAAFVSWRQPDIAPVTLQKQLSTIRQALRWWADIEAVEQGLAEKVHAPEVPDGSTSKDVHLDAERARMILGYLDRYHYASRQHAIFALLWRTGMRLSAIHSLDVDDLVEDEHAVVVEHRPEEGTMLKNGSDGDRWIYVGPEWFQIVKEYAEMHRPDATDDHGREPLFPSERSERLAKGSIYKIVNRWTQPCRYGGCPHGRDESECIALENGKESKCPSSRSPHAIRRGAITHHLNEDVPPEVASERMNVSLEVLYEHYDVRTEQEKMETRKDRLPKE